MKKSLIVLSGLMLFTAASYAVSLGRHRGAALIGRTLDLSVQALLEAQEDPAGLCLEADVFYADTRLDRSRVRVTAEKVSGATQESLIRIRSSALVDEPVVTVYLRTGCQQKTEKRYVVLAELVSDVSSPQASVLPALVDPLVTPSSNTVRVSSNAVVSPSGPSLSQSAGRGKPASGAGSLASGDATGLAMVAQLAARPATGEVAPDGKRKSLPGKTGASLGKNAARLRLEPLDLSMERDPQLKASAQLLTQPTSSEQERSAAAALWRALTVQPLDIVRTANSLDALENSVRGLQEQTQKNQLAIETLGGQLKKAESERYANGLVYALGLLLLGALVALGYLWRRQSQIQRASAMDLPWWRKNEAQQKGWASSTSESDISEPQSQLDGPEKSRREPKKSKPAVLDLDLDFIGQEAMSAGAKPVAESFSAESMLPLARRDRAEFAMSTTSSARAVKAEELFDVQQQADFFVSLGQHDQAIAVLRSHIGDNVQTSALVYLDLFNLYHQLKRQQEYEDLREDFNQRFNAKMPPFELYNDVSPGLDAYQAALTRIEALWPSPKVLEVIEESLFRRPDADAKAFDLEAYRELLLLYAVAREIIEPEAIAVAPPIARESKNSKFKSTAIQPLSASVLPEKPPQFKSSALDAPPLSPQFGLDLDLSQLHVDSASTALAEEASDSSFFAQFAADIALAPAGADKSPGAATDNLIDFDSSDPSFNYSQRQKFPKA